MVKTVLEKNGFEVITATNGHQALKEIKASVPDLMIADLTMPEMDGWRLSMKVREDEQCKNLPIIVLSGLLAAEESRPQQGDPYDLLMAKPFDMIKLVERVKELLAKKNK